MNEVLLEKAINAFKQGKLVAVPTETVYGLAAPMDQLKLVQKIFSLKQRPAENPLIVHVQNLAMAKKYSSDFSDVHIQLAETFWPGALTLLVPKNDRVPDMVTAGSDLVGIRVPQHELTQNLIARLGVPIVAPSANPFTQTSASKAQHVADYFSDQDVYILDGGPCTVGIESTIVSYQNKKLTIHRHGMISAKQIQDVIGADIVIQDAKNDPDQLPGQYRVHYRPRFSMVVSFADHSLKDAYEALTNKKDVDPLQGILIDLSDKQAGDVAKVLYQTILSVDASIAYGLLKLPPHAKDHPSWRGICDRIHKASVCIL